MNNDHYEISWSKTAKAIGGVLVNRRSTTIASRGESNTFTWPCAEKEEEVELILLTSNMNLYANSEPVYVVVPASSAKKAVKDDSAPDPIPLPGDNKKPSDSSEKKPGKVNSNENNSSQTSESIDKTIKTPAIKEISVKNKSMKITWKKAAKTVKGYELQYSTDKKFGVAC